MRTVFKFTFFVLLGISALGFVIVPPAKAWGLVKSANKPTGLPVSFSFHRGW